MAKKSNDTAFVTGQRDGNRYAIGCTLNNKWVPERQRKELSGTIKDAFYGLCLDFGVLNLRQKADNFIAYVWLPADLSSQKKMACKRRLGQILVDAGIVKRYLALTDMSKKI